MGTLTPQNDLELSGARRSWWASAPAQDCVKTAQFVCSSKNDLHIWAILHFLEVGNDFGSSFRRYLWVFAQSGNLFGGAL